MKQVINKIAIILIVILLLINISTNCYAETKKEYVEPKHDYTAEDIRSEEQMKSDREFVDKILNMSGKEIEALSIDEINSYLNQLKAVKPIAAMRNVLDIFSRDGKIEGEINPYKLSKAEIDEAQTRLADVLKMKQANGDDRYINNWSMQVNETLPDSVSSIIGKIIRFLRNISIIVTIVVIIILGIKYMIGSVQQKADYKKSFITIIIGVAVVTLITTVVDVIFSIV